MEGSNDPTPTDERVAWATSSPYSKFLIAPGMGFFLERGEIFLMIRHRGSHKLAVEVSALFRGESHGVNHPNVVRWQAHALSVRPRFRFAIPSL